MISENDVYIWMIPHKRDKYNRIKLISKLRRGIMNKPVTAKYVKARELLDGDEPQSVKVKMFRVLGSWKIDESYDKSNRYANPRYVHSNEISDIETDINARRSWLEECSKYQVPFKWALTRLGITQQALHMYFSRYNEHISYKDMRKGNLPKLARTWHTAYEWGTDIKIISEAFGKAEGTVKNYIRMHSRDKGYKPPEQKKNRNQWQIQ